MKQYRKKPVTIEAIQFDGLNPTEIKDFVGENCEVEIYDNEVTPPVARIVIHTLEGDMEVSKGDYVIKGVKGEFYPCKPDIFQQTYESAETQKELEEEMTRFIEAHYHTRFDETLENGNDPLTVFDFEDIARHFAEWQKEQMLKDAVEGEVYPYHSYNRDATAILVDIPKENLGDKVRIVVLKAEEE